MKFSTIAIISTFASVATAAAFDKRQETLDIKSAAATNLNLNLVTSDVSMKVGLANSVLATVSRDIDPVTVDFLPVDSEYMGYENTDDTKFGGFCAHFENFFLTHQGHIRNTETQQALTASSPGVALGQTVYFSTSSTSDNSSQLLQFWQMDVESMEVKFLGKPKDGNYGEGPLTPQSQNEGDNLAIALNKDTDAKLVLEQK
ncbi:hypothetical protein E3P81_00225 [Wallemia ichthyophaga]|uniref:Uncharacterized protein n=1 Tax=Wallemia ichthyophaga TaxID=245174 RepID=A0A4V4M906_WALIC|nr:hypothetical protein E3P97_00227 [Wallemia ichthyophaga]TIB03693.1 hypothetical protein E3P96_01810 [Wallemia ichthyophaga]TIB35948.1 hypothetical protein E3P85_00244 [Wallemia ichthyophaga]TIB41957.1 hypothetical protein E3P86_00570 [Wallemia ichthyophaga]TIB50984.1 hypothetical protein E3P82_00227 [Wallemia ichthyophaga]